MSIFSDGGTGGAAQAFVVGFLVALGAVAVMIAAVLAYIYL